MPPIEAIANDFKISIDDLIYEIKKIQQDLQEIKQKINPDKAD